MVAFPQRPRASEIRTLDSVSDKRETEFQCPRERKFPSHPFCAWKAEWPLLPGSPPAPPCVAYTEISAVQGTKVTPIPTPTTSQLSHTKHLTSQAYSDTNDQPSWLHRPLLTNHKSTQPVLLSAELSPGPDCPDTDGVLCPPTTCISPIISRASACKP